MKKGKYPKFSVGGYYSKNLKNLSGFLADNAFTTLTAGLGSNIIKQNQYDDTGFGRELGKNQAMKESFDSMQPLGKIGRKTGLISDTPEATGMNDAQYQEYQKWQPIATAGSKVGEAWAMQGMGGMNGMFNMFKKKDKPATNNQADYMNAQRQDQFQPAENSEAYWNTQYANGGKMPNLYNMGGIHPNAEVEKQENTLNPDGSTNQYDGPSHEQGGIGTKLDPNTLIFSDRLKLGKKTFAQLNKQNNTSKEDKILESNKYGKLSKSTAELMKLAKNKNSLSLFEAQENMKKEKVMSYAEKLGFQFGGAFPGMTNPYKYNEKPFPIYGNGGKKGGPTKQSIAEADALPDYTSEAELARLGIVPQIPVTNNTPQYSENGIMMNKLSDLPESEVPNIELKQTKNPKLDNNSNWRGTAGDIGMFLANNMGNLYNLSRYNKPEVETYERAKPTYLDPKASIAHAKRIERNTFKKIKDASTGNAATALSNMASARANTTMDIDRIERDYANANAGIANQFNMYNTGLSKEEVIANAMNRARNRSGQGEAFGNIGYNTANQMRDKRLGDMDQATLDLMMKYYNTPEFQRIMRDNKFKK